MDELCWRRSLAVGVTAFGKINWKTVRDSEWHCWKQRELVAASKNQMNTWPDLNSSTSATTLESCDSLLPGPRAVGCFYWLKQHKMAAVLIGSLLIIYLAQLTRE